MRKIAALLCILICIVSLSSCFSYNRYPDMVEYEEDTVLNIAKETYGIQSFVFTSKPYYGEISTENGFEIESFCYFDDDFVNPVNIEHALAAFAGKNGGHDKMMYQNFLCHVALGIDAEDNARFIYYNTNIHKDATIAETIGMSDYPYDILPTDITDDTFAVDKEWTKMAQFLRENNIKGQPLHYDKDYLCATYMVNREGRLEARYYKENDRVVFDLYFASLVKNTHDEFHEPLLIYSTSERYGVIYLHDGFDATPYIDVTYSVIPSPNAADCDFIKGSVSVKDFGKKVVFSQLWAVIEYMVQNDAGDVVPHRYIGDVEQVTEVTESLHIRRIDGVSHEETAKLIASSCYILYEK